MNEISGDVRAGSTPSAAFVAPCAGLPRALVVLRVWGLTPTDCSAAEADARTDPRLRRFRIDRVETADTPITAAGDPDAIAHEARYGRTWAAYPAGQPR